MKFLTDFTYRNLHGFAQFPSNSTALVVQPVRVNESCAGCVKSELLQYQMLLILSMCRPVNSVVTLKEKNGKNKWRKYKITQVICCVEMSWKKSWTLVWLPLSVHVIGTLCKCIVIYQIVCYKIPYNINKQFHTQLVLLAWCKEGTVSQVLSYWSVV